MKTTLPKLCQLASLFILLATQTISNGQTTRFELEAVVTAVDDEFESVVSRNDPVLIEVSYDRSAVAFQTNNGGAIAFYPLESLQVALPAIDVTYEFDVSNPVIGSDGSRLQMINDLQTSTGVLDRWGIVSGGVSAGQNLAGSPLRQVQFALQDVTGVALDSTEPLTSLDVSVFTSFARTGVLSYGADTPSISRVTFVITSAATVPEPSIGTLASLAAGLILAFHRSRQSLRLA
ncbi:MAG: hypothetical protein RH917_02195 [Lacipirellulaceae bacterium]